MRGGDVDDGGGQTLRDLVRSAREALEEVAATRSACPAGADRFDWSADLLDELARLAGRVGDAASALAGGPDDEVEARARALATALVRRRNDALVPLRLPRQDVLARRG